MSQLVFPTSKLLRNSSGQWFLPKGMVVEHMTTLDKIPFILGIANFQKGLRNTAINWCNNQNILAGMPPIYSEDIPSGLLPKNIPTPDSKYSGVYVYSQNNFKVYSNNLNLIAHKMSLPVILRINLKEDTPVIADDYYVPFGMDFNLLNEEDTWERHGSCVLLSENSWHADDIEEFRYLNFQHQLNEQQLEIFLRTAHLARLESILFIPSKFPPLKNEHETLNHEMKSHRLWSKWLEFEEDEIECLLEEILDTDALATFWDGISFDNSMMYQQQYYQKIIPEEVTKRCSEAMVYRKVGKLNEFKKIMKNSWRNYIEYV